MRLAAKTDKNMTTNCRHGPLKLKAELGPVMIHTKVGTSPTYTLESCQKCVFQNIQNG